MRIRNLLMGIELLIKVKSNFAIKWYMFYQGDIRYGKWLREKEREDRWWVQSNWNITKTTFVFGTFCQISNDAYSKNSIIHWFVRNTNIATSRRIFYFGIWRKGSPFFLFPLVEFTEYRVVTHLFYVVCDVENMNGLIWDYSSLYFICKFLRI